MIPNTTESKWITSLLEKVASPAFHGYGLKPIPSPLDPLLHTLAVAHIFGWIPCSALSFKVSDVMGAYAERMAAQTLRTGEGYYCVLAASAYDLAIPCSIDTRAIIMSLSTLYHSWSHLPERPHLELSELPRFTAMWREYLQRKDLHRIIDVMGLSIVDDAEGPRYKYK